MEEPQEVHLRIYGGEARTFYKLLRRSLRIERYEANMITLGYVIGREGTDSWADFRPVDGVTPYAGIPLVEAGHG